jgi:hypothetical protein
MTQMGLGLLSQEGTKGTKVFRGSALPDKLMH